ncbi:MAG TPA: hypothetical protein VMV72_20265 [Verrucomicrobiae bacterium]|nr:hypothetical protein [Verrucomicrobiae bacterium]
MKRVIKFVFGLLAFLIGAAILLWFAYRLFVPNQDIPWGVLDLPRLAIAAVMLWFGWDWIRIRSVETREYASELAVTVKLSNSEFGTQSERTGILTLKHRLEGKLDSEALGEIDGEEFGNGECTLFVQTDAPAEAEELIRGFFASEAPSLTLSISKRGGDRET